MNEYMKLALKEADKAFKKDEVPVGAIIVKNNKIISKAYNKKEHKHDVSAHAEMLAIRKACKKLKTWHLDDCEIYITLEPCMMCCGAIEQARIKKIYYCTESKQFGQIENNYKVFESKKIEINKNIYKEESQKKLNKFFKQKRK